MNTKFFAGPALILAATLGAQAQTQPGKVGVIAIQQAIISTKDGQKAAADLDAKTAPKKKAIEQKQNNITSLQDQLNKGQNTLSEATKTDLYKNIETKKKSLQREVEDAQAELDQTSKRYCSSWAQKIMAVIEKYARDNGFTMVVDVSSPQTPLLYASPSIDITKEIIELYDKSRRRWALRRQTASRTACSRSQASLPPRRPRSRLRPA